MAMTSGLVYVDGRRSFAQFGSFRFGNRGDGSPRWGTEDGDVPAPGTNVTDIQNEWTHVLNAGVVSTGEGQELIVLESENLAPGSSRIDWVADDEDELPPIEGLHAKFGT